MYLLLQELRRILLLKLIRSCDFSNESIISYKSFSEFIHVLSTLQVVKDKPNESFVDVPSSSNSKFPDFFLVCSVVKIKRFMFLP